MHMCLHASTHPHRCTHAACAPSSVSLSVSQKQGVSQCRLWSLLLYRVTNMILMKTSVIVPILSSTWLSFSSIFCTLFGWKKKKALMLIFFNTQTWDCSRPCVQTTVWNLPATALRPPPAVKTTTLQPWMASRPWSTHTSFHTLLPLALLLMCQREN